MVTDTKVDDPRYLPGGLPRLAGVLPTYGQPTDDIAADAWLAVDPRTAAVYVKVSGAWEQIAGTGASASIQFSEGTSDSTPANPSNVNKFALYLGRTAGGNLSSLYIWSISLGQWVPIITP